MADGINELTEKEKEALRLLRSGHDAKSSASELGLSVHTINDRLRNARRKLGVSSSREAARILGYAEGSTPQKLAPEGLGIADTADHNDDVSIARQEETGSSGSNWQMKGLLVMTSAIALGALALALSNTGIDEAAVDAPPVDEAEPIFAESVERDTPAANQAPQSESAAREWLALLGAGDAEGTRSAAAAHSELLRSSDEFWELAVALHGNNNGALIERRLLTVEAIPVPAAVDAEAAERLVFTADYSQTRNALESLTMVHVDGVWRPAAYQLERPGEDSAD